MSELGGDSSAPGFRGGKAESVPSGQDGGCMEQRGSCRGKGEGCWVSAPGWGEGKMGRNVSWEELRKWRVQFGAASSMSWEPSSAALLLGHTPLSSSPMPTTPSGHTGLWDAPSQHPALTHTLVTPKSSHTAP